MVVHQPKGRSLRKQQTDEKKNGTEREKSYNRKRKKVFMLLTKGKRSIKL